MMLSGAVKNFENGLRAHEMVCKCSIKVMATIMEKEID